jgi:hypothetical protein
MPGAPRKIENIIELSVMKTDWDNLLFRGAAIFAVGLSLIHPPSAVLFTGAAMMGWAVFGAWAEARRPAAKVAETADDG